MYSQWMTQITDTMWQGVGESVCVCVDVLPDVISQLIAHIEYSIMIIIIGKWCERCTVTNVKM